MSTTPRPETADQTPWPSSGTRQVSAIARLVAADEDTVRDVIHAFNTRGLPRWTLSGRAKSSRRRVRASRANAIEMYQDWSARALTRMDDERRHTLPVDDDVFRTVYDSPASLPGCYKWLTSDEDVRRIESLLGMPPGTIGAPLWLSGDEKSCSSCGRLISWLDIVSSGVAGVHSPEMIANVILGDRKYINTEAPRAISGLRCTDCNTAFEGLRSFKCHNWAYAVGDLLEVVASMKQAIESR